MKAAVIDDEPLARARLKRLLAGQGVDVIAEGQNGLDAIRIATDEAIDILFLDINMPAMNGLEAAQKIDGLLSQAPAIVFCTAYEEHAIEAFATNAVAYLLKPFSETDLSKAIEQANTLNRLHINQLDTKGDDAQAVITNASGELLRIQTSDIIYFYSKDKHVYAGLLDASDRLIDSTLKQLELSLGTGFVRAHRNTLVNVGYIERLYKSDDGGSLLDLKGLDSPVSISRRHLAGVKKCFV